MRCISFEASADLEVVSRCCYTVVLSERWVLRLHFRWSRGKLKLAEHVELDEACPQQIYALLLHVWGFRT